MLLQPLHEPAADRAGVQLLLLRDDLNHPELPGNKWRKLTYNLREAQRLGHSTLLTFGGAYSNHLAAVAAAGRLTGLQTVGVVRGEELRNQPLNSTLARARQDGMRLHFLDRATYRRKHQPEVLAALLQELGPAYVLPEGGSNALALPGCAELVPELLTLTDFDTLCVACGTGGTLAGLLVGLGGQREALGIAALKGADFLRTDINALTQQAAGRVYSNWTLRTDYHGGGYARLTPELRRFVQAFQQRHGVLLDPIYTSKMLMGILDLLAQGHFRRGSTVVAIHTGGLQAWAGFGGV
ncbi:1-aminocyclopropane-1-carboxylate deaminase/D-cysteine desulfhydrase-like pyridoxal-dependent ACC family enzyme [Hymenobacter luteus]|uniref:1-aminocyclopropane-1-carboxylate deaminase/D-cysteine desulfhydrase-like pyridoxal-dependent ACC family enzyme n=2 Tax=Hymenobacter TaxID=89966 RepID=A0A7W9T2N2_9BACT|nr:MULTISPECIES: pyridoxal-phosphate dependent enzyme [Hymenobacter]MBB4602420.1 1-aminocyclopropane-1-carboxylate deaminase/D-cysteine desulfhydrase-like pyridoxal-dependent ACC family enzyme [Hymenobacter latericoloratus]MBB6060311.1 1-aminocyclopropane-1-carboxylate deaminase/D-cysteine desulfhydrase-like pyridoxal-dependent ACC family enzyme [Hymenobacter luteus]